MPRDGILCAGNWIVDRVKMIDGFPAEETLANITSESRQNGGAAFNVLVDLAKLGANFPLYGLGCIGNDADGEFIRSLCRDNGIDASHLITVSEPTSFTDVMTVTGTGKRTFFHHRGANALLGTEHFDFATLPCQHLHLGYLLLLDGLDAEDPEFGTTSARVLSEAQAHGITTSVDVVSNYLGRSQAVVRDALRYVDLCFMNELELGFLVGETIADNEPVDSLWHKTKRLFEDGFGSTLVVHSAKFAHVITAKGVEHSIESIKLPLERIKGTVGAGDAFAAGFLMAFLEGKPSETCLQWAAAAGASCLLGEGASNGVLPIEEACQLRFNS